MMGTEAAASTSISMAMTTLEDDTTPSSSRPDDAMLEGNRRVALEHGGLLQQSAHLSSTLARRRADLALMQAEAATVAISLEAAKHDLDITLKDEAAIRAGAPSSPVLTARSRADFVPDVGLVRALRGQLDVTRSSVRDALSKRDALLKEIAALESCTTAQMSSSGRTHFDHRKTDSVKDAFLSTGTSSLGSQSLDSSYASRYDPSYSPADPVISSSSNLEQSILRLLDEGASSRSSFRSDHARIRRDNMPNLILTKDVDRTTEDPRSDEDDGRENGDGGETVGGDSDKKGDGNVAGLDGDVILGVVTERVFEGVTCFTPLVEESEVDTKPVYKLDGRIHSFGPAFRPTDKLCERVANQYGVLRAFLGDRGRHVKIIAPKAALRRVCRLASDAVTRPIMRRHTYSVLDDSSSASRTPGTVSLSNLKQNSTSEKLHVDFGTPPYMTSNLSGSIDAKHRAKSAPITSVEPVLPIIRKTKPSSVLTDDQFAQVVGHGVPVRFHESTLTLLYSTEHHGMSLRTLYTMVHETSPTIVAILDTQKRSFGCYAAQPWKASATRYYGSGESFVFGIDKTTSETQIFKWSRANSFFQFTSMSFLAIGGGTGSHFALWVDEDLLMGTTSACSTFASPPLTDLVESDNSSCNEFKILSLEVWGFRTGR